MSHRELFGLFYGALTAAVYVGFKQFGTNGGLPLFAGSCVLLFLLNLFYSPRRALKGLRTPANILRGLSFGLAQALLLRAQVTDGTSTVFLAAVTGAVTASTAGHYLLKEQRSRLDIAALSLCFLGLWIGNPTFAWNHWALAGGFVQGATAAIARSMMKSGTEPFEALTSGYLLGGVVGFGFLAAMGGGSLDIAISPQLIVISALAIAAVQHAFFKLYNLLDIQKATILSLSRIPWAILIEGLLLQSIPTLSKVSSVTLMLLGAGLSLIRPPQGPHTGRAATNPRPT